MRNDKSLGTYNLPRLNYEKIENLKRPTINKEIQSVIKTSQQRKPRTYQMVSLESSTKHLEIILTQSSSNYFKIVKRKSSKLIL